MTDDGRPDNELKFGNVPYQISSNANLHLYNIYMVTYHYAGRRRLRQYGRVQLKSCIILTIENGIDVENALESICIFNMADGCECVCSYGIHIAVCSGMHRT